MVVQDFYLSCTAQRFPILVLEKLPTCCVSEYVKCNPLYVKWKRGLSSPIFACQNKGIYFISFNPVTFKQARRTREKLSVKIHVCTYSVGPTAKGVEYK